VCACVCVCACVRVCVCDQLWAASLIGRNAVTWHWKIIFQASGWSYDKTEEARSFVRHSGVHNFFGIWFCDVTVFYCSFNHSGGICHDVFWLYGRLGRAAEREWTERNATGWRAPCRKFLATPLVRHSNMTDPRLKMSHSGERPCIICILSCSTIFTEYWFLANR